MRYLFVDNFRGFTKTFIPIKDVNFLVGENSTGKTSILGLINLLSSPMFIHRLSFDTEEFKFGHFKDMVSIHAEDRDYFTIGYIGGQQDKKNGSKKVNRKAYLMTFKELKGMPIIHRYTYLSADKEIMIEFGDEVRYSSEDIEPIKDDMYFLNNIYSKWIKSHHEEQKNYSVLQEPKIPRSFKTLIFPMAMFVEDALLGKKEIRSSLSWSLSRSDYFDSITWLAPIRTKPRRTYDEYNIDFTPEGSHTPYLIKDILEKREASKRFIKFINKIGNSSGLFETISIKKYGQDDLAPFEVDVQIKNKSLSINNVGYGVSQILPVLVEVFARSKGSWFAIQQPEIHLHPRAQASLGDIFYELCITERKKFIIETHSDFTIDRFRLNYSKRKSSQKPSAQILFFERGSKGNIMHEIQIKPDGNLQTTQPKSFRKFFIKEEMKILGL